jgi:hypothetical protein
MAKKNANTNDDNELYQNRDDSTNNLRPDTEWERDICGSLGYYGKIVSNLGGISAVAKTDEFMTRDDLEKRLKSKVTGKLLGAFGMSKGIFGKYESDLVDREDITSLLVRNGFFNDKSEAMITAEEMIQRGIGGCYQRNDESDYFFKEYTNTMGKKKYKLMRRPVYDYGY